MIRSPFFYVGDKYKLVPQLQGLFPHDINTYVEPFYGGGSSQLQVQANHYCLNDIDKYVIKLHRFLLRYRNRRNIFFARLYDIIDRYGFSCSFRNINVPTELKRQYVKTYYSVYNNNAYQHLKDDFNAGGCKDMLMLYVLLIYGFNHMIRFNSKGLFNLPVGNVDFNKNVFDALNSYFDLQENRDLNLYSMDFERFINRLNLNNDDFVYFDPPYLISSSEYNKLWDEDNERRLYNLIDTLNRRGIRFGITNLLVHKGVKNTILEEWSRRYFVEVINSNYISYNDNSIKDGSIEIYVHN